jgi:hypothetical protein
MTYQHTAISPGSSSPPTKRAILEWEAFRIAHGIPPASPTEVATSPSYDTTSPNSKRALLEPEALNFPPTSSTKVATSPSCDITIDESSPRSVLVELSFGTSPFADKHYAAISGAVAQQIAHTSYASARRLFPRPGISPSTSGTSERGSTSPPPTRLPLSLSSAANVSHMLPRLEKHLQDFCDRLENDTDLRRERADHEFRDHLDDAREEAELNIRVAKDEGIESLNDACDTVLREFENELLSQIADFSDHLDTIKREVIAKVDDDGEIVISKAVEKAKHAVAMMSEADEKMKDAAVMMSKAEKKAKEAASLFDAATNLSGNRLASSRRSFTRGKGNYRGLGNRFLRNRVGVYLA